MDRAITNPKFQAIDGNGNPLVGGLVYTYDPGGVVQKTTYSDRALSSPNAFPVVLDSRGEASIFCSGTIKLILKSSDGVTIWTMDNLASISTLTIIDNDSDTKIQVEEAADEDKIRFDTGGTQRAMIDSDGLTLAAGASVNEFSTDGTFAGNSDDACPTEKAAKTYVDAAIVTGTAHLLPRGYLAGLGMTIAADTDHDISIAAGECRDSGNTHDITNSAAKVKQIDAAWAAGTNAGGMFTGVVGVSTWYHVFVIFDPVNTLYDAGFDTSITAANRPAAYTKYRRIGSVLTDGASNILGFVQYGDDFYWKDPPLDIDVTNPGTNAVTRVLSVPTGLAVKAYFNVASYDPTAASIITTYCSPLTVNDEASSNTAAPLGSETSYPSSQTTGLMQERVWTDTAASIRSRVNATSATSLFKIATLGWMDRRGRDD